MPKPIENWVLKLGDRILSRCRHHGFMSAITKAERGYGKSMYNLKVMAYVHYHLNGGDEEQAWKQALNSIIFTPDDLLTRIERNIEQEIVSPVWCIDDATVHFSSYLYFINLYQTSLLNACFDTMRTVANAVLLNCPDKSRLLSGLRHYDDFEITIYKTPGSTYMRRAVGIKWYSLPDGHRKFRKEFEDHFSCYVYDHIYDKYMVMRKQYLKEVSSDLRKLQEKLSERKTFKQIGDS